MSTEALNTEELYDRHVLGNYAKAPLTLVRGEGTRVWDDTGKEYLDFISGIAVNALGHCHPRWVQRVAEQAGKLVHCSNLFRNPNQAELARKLTDLAGPGRVFLGNSGTEATEALIKLARLYGAQRAGKEGVVYKVISAHEAFHGRSFGAMAATPQDKIQGGFQPMLHGFGHAALNDVADFAQQVDETTAAILLEPIQGETGVNICEDKFLREIRALCDEREILLLLDEVQSGAGRTGQYFAYEHAGICPDALGMAKGLGGGFPIGAIWIAEDYQHLYTAGTHGSTFGGSPLACAAALAVMEVMEEEDLLEQIRTKSRRWHEDLNTLVQEHPEKVAEIRARGFLVGVAMTSDPTPVITALRDQGLLTVAASGDVIRLLPPYTASSDDLLEAVSIFHRVLQ